MDFINKLIIANELEDVFNDTLNIINSNDILKIIRKITNRNYFVFSRM